MTSDPKADLDAILKKVHESGCTISQASTMSLLTILTARDLQASGKLVPEQCSDLSVKVLLLYRQVVAIELLKGLIRDARSARLPVETLIINHHAKLVEKYERTSREFENLVEILK